MTALRVLGGDLDITGGRFTLISGAEEKAQKITNALELARGEWFLDIREGVPYFEAILGARNPDLEIVKRIFRRTILSVEGIVDVLDLVLTLGADRELAYSWIAIDDEGTQISGGIGAPFIVEES